MEEIKIKVLQVDHNQRPTKKGDPQIGVKTEKGWLKLSGGDVKSVKAGDVLLLNGEPQQFGKSWYGRLKEIERQSGNGKSTAQSTQEKPTLDEILDVIDRILSHLPETWRTDPSFIHGPRACAQIVNTLLMGIEHSEIAIDEPEPDYSGSDTPPPTDEDRPAWER